MRNRRPLDVVLCWHMHQPQYRNPDGIFERPWAYLHAIKDYTDMAAHLEAIPGAHAVVNFSTVLLEQIDDYVARIASHLDTGGDIGDPLLDALASGAQHAGDRASLIQSCLKANEAHMIEAHPAYATLARNALAELKGSGKPLTDEELNDLVCWYHLVWFGESIVLAYSCPVDLIDKGGRFSSDDRKKIVSLIGELMRGIVPRYRALAERGIIEISVSPHTHPMLPLLLDFSVAREAMPDVALPDLAYPDAARRCAWQLDRAMSCAEKYFGIRPRGCWPSEGGLSEQTMPLLASAGFRWTASGTATLHHSLAEVNERSHLKAWRHVSEDLCCFFRDDTLSDLIGFSYSSWEAEHAVDDFIERLENIAERRGDEAQAVVSIILDGENAWDYYPRNARDFLRALYSRLASHPGLNLTTFSQHMDDAGDRAMLPRLVAGSWVSGNFGLWVGHPDKNRAWDLLIQMRRDIDPVRDAADTTLMARIDEQIAVCEGSDWFWWFGDDNSPLDIAQFDALYRDHLRSAYQVAGLMPPPVLDQPIARRVNQEAAQPGPHRHAGVMRESDS